MFKIIGETAFDFLGKRKIAFLISGILSVLGIIGIVMIGIGKAEMGIDFAGGVMVQGSFAQTVTIDQVRAAIGQEFSDASVTNIADASKPNTFIVKVKRPQTEAEGKERLARVQSIMQSAFPGNTFTVESEHLIGPAVGQTLRKDASYAIIISLLGILAYIAVRFDFRFGVAATIATFHDVLAVIGIFWVFGLEFDLLFVTALLTLAGYSLTDTVVVFDRIRENFKKFRAKADFIKSINSSINETLSRTLNTSMTVMLVVVVLYFFGGEVLRNFSLAMILGILVGTYSSIFVASPILVEWESASPRRTK